MHLKDIMSHPAITCPVGATLDRAAWLMWEFDCGMILLVHDDGRTAGVITDRDICMAAYTQGRPLRDIPLTTAMTTRVVAADVHDTVEAVEEIMRAQQVRRVPVLDADGRAIGVVSMSDMARFAAHAKKSGVDRELVQTLAAVSRPRLLAGSRAG